MNALSGNLIVSAASFCGCGTISGQCSLPDQIFVLIQTSEVFTQGET